MNLNKETHKQEETSCEHHLDPLHTNILYISTLNKDDALHPKTIEACARRDIYTCTHLFKYDEL